MNNNKITATTTRNETTFDDVVDEILTTLEPLTGVKLNEWISRYPQFEQDLTDFAVDEAISEFDEEPETLTEPGNAARLARSQRIASNAVKCKFNGGANIDIKNIDTSKAQSGEMPKVSTFYADNLEMFVPREDSEIGAGFFLFKNSADVESSKLVLMERAAIKEAIYKLHAQLENESCNHDLSS